jgi:transposase InsO family protein
MDLFRPVAYLSIEESKYGLVIVDDFSRFTWVFFLQNKSETQGTLKRFLRRAQNEFELKVKKIRIDNGSEFKNLRVEEYLEEEGIKHKFSAPYTQNGVVERKNRTLIDMARTMLGEYKTPERFWSEAVNTACHAINQLYLHRLLKKTSYKLLTGNYHLIIVQAMYSLNETKDNYHLVIFSHKDYLGLYNSFSLIMFNNVFQNAS